MCDNILASASLFVEKNPQLNRNLTKFFPATLLAGESLEPLIELQSPCSNTAASMGFYRTAPPLDTKICTAAALLPRNWVSFQEYPPFHKRDSVTGSTANSQGLQIWFSCFSLSTLCINFLSSHVIGWKELHNCTFPKGRTSLLLSFWYHFPITGDLSLCSINIYWVMSSVI